VLTNQNYPEKDSIWDRNFIQYILNMVGACIVSLAVYALWWYGPLIAFAIYLFAAPKLMKKKPINIAQIYVMRTIYLILGIIFIVFQAIIFQIHIGSWYGWLVGALSSWIILGMLAAHLDDWLRSSIIP
jgi:hypothetical protein